MMSIPVVSGDRKSPTEIPGLDYLRAFGCLGVIAIHNQLFSDLLSKGGVIASLGQVIDGNILSLMVPIFLHISFLLFYNNRRDHKYITRRLPKLFKLYIFWTVCFTIFLGSLETIKNFKSLLIFIISGGNSMFYFFFTLLILIPLAELLLRIGDRFKLSPGQSQVFFGTVFWGSCILLFGCEVFVCKTNAYPGLIAYWNPLNFVPYVATGFLILKDYQTGDHKAMLTKAIGLLVISLGLLLLEWSYLQGITGFSLPLPRYTRLSIIFASWGVVYLALLFLTSPPPPIKLLSDCSLGIYCLHPFLLGLLHGLPQFKTIMPQNLLHFVLVIPLAIGGTLLLKKIPIIKELIQ